MKSVELVLQQETKLHCLLPKADAKSDLEASDLEASGMIKVGGRLYVVFDNRVQIAQLHSGLGPDADNRFLGPDELKMPMDGFEGLGWDACRKRFLLLVESLRQGKGRYVPEIVEYRRDGRFHSRKSIDFEFKCRNKGFESIYFEDIDHQRRLWALCESNGCACGKKGKRPGRGRIQVFTAGKKKWKHVDTVKLPKSVKFRDYSAIAVHEGRIAVASQQDSALWVGSFDPRSRTWKDDGRHFHFPRDQGRICYGNIEGLAWLSKRRIYAVSDRAKSDQTPSEIEKDQSIHLFEIPR